MKTQVLLSTNKDLRHVTRVVLNGPLNRRKPRLLNERANQLSLEVTETASPHAHWVVEPEK